VTRYLLDTNILIDFSQRLEPNYSRLLAMIANGEALSVCDVVIAEYFAGLLPARRSDWSAFFRRFELLAAGREASARSGMYRYEFARRGITLSLADSLIAATAHEHDAVIVSRNVRHFPMADVTVIPELPSVAPSD
jgi:predicted nucleic acid-binding protein